MRHAHHHGEVRRSERAQSLVEIALTLPILCLMLVAAAQYGVMIWRGMELTSATRDGARHAAVARNEANPVQAVQQVVRTSLDTTSPSDVTVAVTGGWDRADNVVVRSTMPYALDIMGVEVWSGRLRSEQRVRIG